MADKKGTAIGIVILYIEGRIKIGIAVEYKDYKGSFFLQLFVKVYVGIGSGTAAALDDQSARWVFKKGRQIFSFPAHLIGSDKDLIGEAVFVQCLMDVFNDIRIDIVLFTGDHQIDFIFFRIIQYSGDIDAGALSFFDNMSLFQ